MKKSTILFNQKPKCELLGGKHIASHFVCQDGKWLFVSTEAPENYDDYQFEIDDFFKSPSSTVDWMAHLQEKEWFDAADFFVMMDRFREATRSFGQL